MNGIDESSPTCRQPVTFFGVFPVTWDPRSPDSAAANGTSREGQRPCLQ